MSRQILNVFHSGKEGGNGTGSNGTINAKNPLAEGVQKQDEKRLFFIDKKKTAYFEAYCVPRLLEYHIFPDMVAEIIRQIELIYKKDKQDFIGKYLPGMLEPDLSLHALDKAIQKLEYKYKRHICYFIEYCVPTVFMPNTSFEAMKKSLDEIRESMLSKRFVSGEILKNIQFRPSHSCEDTRGYFLSALKRGLLIKTKATVDGKEMDIYVKGFLSNSGNVLAFEPNSNTIYSIWSEGDGTVNVAGKTYAYTHKKLRKAILKKEAELSDTAPVGLYAYETTKRKGGLEA